jgi:hypothetical protein
LTNWLLQVIVEVTQAHLKKEVIKKEAILSVRRVQYD